VVSLSQFEENVDPLLRGHLSAGKGVRGIGCFEGVKNADYFLHSFILPWFPPVFPFWFRYPPMPAPQFIPPGSLSPRLLHEVVPHLGRGAVLAADRGRGGRTVGKRTSLNGVILLGPRGAKAETSPCCDGSEARPSDAGLLRPCSAAQRQASRRLRTRVISRESPRSRKMTRWSWARRR
jgi:hypothetical protein